MGYYDDEQNKIRRKKVSSNNSNYRPSTQKNTSRSTRSVDSAERKREVNNSNSRGRTNRSKARKKKKSKNVINIMKKLLIVVLILGFIASALATLVVNIALKDSPDMTYKYLREKSVSSKYVSMVDIPVELRNAVVAIEDERFYKHRGVDGTSLARSVIHNIFSESTQGGSTIEMQLSKNLVTTMDQTIKRKIKDMYNAKQMNKNMNKREILELYLNNIYLGKSAYGVAKGAEVYFGKDIKDLNLGECAMLVGITNNPKLYSNDYMAAKKRRDTILYKMKELKYITKDEYEKTKKEETPMKTK